MQPDDFLDELMDAIECRYPGAKAEAERIIEERGGIRPFAEFWAKVLADVEAQKSIALNLPPSFEETRAPSRGQPVLFGSRASFSLSVLPSSSDSLLSVPLRHISFRDNTYGSHVPKL